MKVEITGAVAARRDRQGNHAVGHRQDRHGGGHRLTSSNTAARRSARSRWKAGWTVLQHGDRGRAPRAGLIAPRRKDLRLCHGPPALRPQGRPVGGPAPLPGGRRSIPTTMRSGDKVVTNPGRGYRAPGGDLGHLSRGCAADNRLRPAPEDFTAAAKVDAAKRSARLHGPQARARGWQDVEIDTVFIGSCTQKEGSKGICAPAPPPSLKGKEDRREKRADGRARFGGLVRAQAEERRGLADIFRTSRFGICALAGGDVPCALR